jgi:predicted nucleic-acid-binding Zn-ribbon protein
MKDIYNVSRMRSCPKCGGTHYVRSTLSETLREFKGGEKVQEWYEGQDPGHFFWCCACGFAENSWGNELRNNPYIGGA